MPPRELIEYPTARVLEHADVGCDFDEEGRPEPEPPRVGVIAIDECHSRMANRTPEELLELLRPYATGLMRVHDITYDHRGRRYLALVSVEEAPAVGGGWVWNEPTMTLPLLGTVEG